MLIKKSAAVWCMILNHCLGPPYTPTVSFSLHAHTAAISCIIATVVVIPLCLTRPACVQMLSAVFLSCQYSWLFKPIKNRDTIKYHNNFTNAEMSNHQTPNVINFVYVPKTFLRGY